MSLAQAPSLGPVHTDHLQTIRSLVSSAWHGVCQFAIDSPWFAVLLLIPALVLLVGCTRVTVRRS